MAANISVVEVAAVLSVAEAITEATEVDLLVFRFLK
jgi:hypothetical protein